MIHRQNTTQQSQRADVVDTWCAEIMRPDTLDPIILAAGLIWAGLVVLANGLGYLDGQAWSLFFLGAGGLVLVELAIRLLVPVHRRDLLGTLILATILLGLGTGSWGIVLPAVLIGLGAYILLRGSLRSWMSI